MKIGIIIPAVNCLKYSKKTIESIKTNHDYQIVFIDDGSTDGTKDWLKTREDIISYINPKTGSLSGNWNLGIKRAMQEDCELFLILNNDIILSATAIDNMVKKMMTDKYVLVSGVNQHEGIDNPEDMMEKVYDYDPNEPDNYHPDFSCFMINKRYLDIVGYFDENFFVAYFEDNDAHARIALSGEKAVSTISATYYHYESKTVKNNKHLQDIIHEAFDRNKEYFKEKYGCYPVGDVSKMIKKYYKTPFNDPNKKINDITGNFEIL